MAYEITVGEQKFLIAVQRRGELFDVSIGDRVFRVDIGYPGLAELSLLIEGRSYDVHVEKLNDQVRIIVDGQSFEVSVRDESKKSPAKPAGGVAAEGEHLLSSAMPGKVVKILVEENQAVKKNQGVIIIEAMKMENELKTPKDGFVKKVLVKEGQNVEGREGLLLIA